MCFTCIGRRHDGKVLSQVRDWWVVCQFSYWSMSDYSIEPCKNRRVPETKVVHKDSRRFRTQVFRRNCNPLICKDPIFPKQMWSAMGNTPNAKHRTNDVELRRLQVCEVISGVLNHREIFETRHFFGAGLKLRVKNNQKGFNFNFLRDDSKFI